jgi:hypothetical protein
MSLSTLRDFNDPSTIRYNTNLYVAQSSIPNSGKGLLTRYKIKKGKIICEYFGEFVLHENLDSVENKHYLVSNDNGIIINGLNNQGKVVCAAAYINDPMNDIYSNCEFHWVNGRCYIRACQDIDEDEELFISYGPDYWFSTEFDSILLQKACDGYAYNNDDIENWETLIIEVQEREAAAAAIDAAIVADNVIEIIDLTADDPIIIDLSDEDSVLTVLTVITEVSDLSVRNCTCDHKRKYEDLGFDENDGHCRFF